MKRLLAITAAILILNTLAFAAGDYGTPGEFLNWGAGARALGMGRAFTGLADDVSAIYYNPAGLAQQNPFQVSLMHVTLFYDTMYDFAATSYPVSGIGTFGAAYIRLGSTNFDGRDILANPTGNNQSVTEQAAMLCYARDIFSNLSAGINLKLVNEDIFNTSGIGFGADLGFLYTPNEYVNLGLDFMNLAPASIKLVDQAEILPLTIKAGIALKLLGERIIPVVDVQKEMDDKQVKFLFGIEGYPAQFLALRIGMDETEQLTVGAGINFMKYYKIDYSFASEALGYSNRLSITMAFGGFDVNLAADPKIFSPVGIKKTTTISIYAMTKYDITEWELDIINEDGDVVRTYSGEDKPPTSVMWDGKDDRGLPVSDGEYVCQMKVKDKNGKEIKSNDEKIKISSALPIQPGTLEIQQEQ